MLNYEFSVATIGGLHVAELAERVGVTPATVRYYARIRLLTPTRDPENGYRCFSFADVRRVEFIRQAQTLGLTIGDIKEVLEAVDEGKVPCDQVKELVKKRLVKVQDRLTELVATEVRMTDAIESWVALDNPAPQDGEICPLIERVEVSNCQASQALSRRTRRLLRADACYCPPPEDAARHRPNQRLGAMVDVPKPFEACGSAGEA